MPPAGPAEPRLQSLPRRLALGYAVLAGLWILLSDRLVQGESWPPWAQTVKGWLFVTVTAIGLYLLTRRLTRHVFLLHDELRRRADELEIRVEERTAALTSSHAELDSFVHAASHDLRAPIRSVAGFAQALAEDYGDRLDEGGRDYLRRIGGAAERMDAMVLSLRDYNQLGRATLPLAAVSLQGVIASVAAAFRPDAVRSGASIALVPPFPAVLAHAETLTRVIQNLMDNALKFVPLGRAAAVRVWAEPQPGSLVRTWVEDRGIGIPPEGAARIFQPFERLHSSATYPGTGLGLAIVRRGVERMGGAVGVEPLAGGGARFWFDLPAATVVQD